MKMTSTSLAETKKIARQFLKTLTTNKKRATVVGLYGELGSGKTTFTQQIAQIFGIEETVTSPTFVIQKRYELKGSMFDALYHIDAYRLESGEELRALGWGDIVQNSKNIIFIEWPERVENILPQDIRNVAFTFVDEDTRAIVLP